MNQHVTLSLSQMAGAWRLMCSGVPSAVVEEQEGITYIFSGLPVGFFNLAMLTGSNVPASALAALGSDACAWAARQPVPWLLAVTQECLAPGVDAVATLDASGLAPVMPLTGMRARTVTAAPAVPGLQLAVPQDDDGCGTIVDLNSRAYEMDLAACKPAIGVRAFWKDQFPVLGVLDGNPVSSATVMMVDGVRYVALVATDPDHRRRGYADAAMRQALANAARVHGETSTVLHATEAGRPVYERMGYETISTHMLFMDKHFLH